MSKLFSNKVLLKFTVFISLTFSFYQLSAQINVTRYQRDFYMVGPRQVPYKIVNTKDSGTCVYGAIQYPSGFTYSELTKLDKSGNLVWTKGYTTNIDSVFSISSVQNTIDNGFLMAGCYVNNITNMSNYYYPVITKVNSSGNVIWSKSYAPMFGNIIHVQEFSDSSIILSLGYYTGSLWVPVLQKLDKNGNILWSRKTIECGYVAERPNKNIQLCTWYGDLKEYDNNGNGIWEKNYHSLTNYMQFWEMGTNANNEIVMIGDHMDSIINASPGLIVIKTNGKGLISFAKKYTLSSGGKLGTGRSGNFAKDCGIYMAANFLIGSVGNNSGLIKFDSQGNLQWVKIYDRTANNTPMGAITTNDGGYSLISSQGGVSYPFARVIKIDKNGTTPCNNDTLVVITNTVIPLLVDSTLHPSAVLTITNTNIPMITISNLMNMGIQCSDIISQIPDNCISITTNISALNPNGIKMLLFPNPCHDIVTLNTGQSEGKNSIEIYNPIGQKIIEFETFEREIKFDLSKESSGIYFIRILNNNSIHSIKFIKE